MSRLPRLFRDSLALIVLAACVYAEFVWLGVVPSPWSQ